MPSHLRLQSSFEEPIIAHANISPASTTEEAKNVVDIDLHGRLDRTIEARS